MEASWIRRMYKLELKGHQFGQRPASTIGRENGQPVDQRKENQLRIRIILWQTAIRTTGARKTVCSFKQNAMDKETAARMESFSLRKYRKAKVPLYRENRMSPGTAVQNNGRQK